MMKGEMVIWGGQASCLAPSRKSLTLSSVVAGGSNYGDPVNDHSVHSQI